MRSSGWRARATSRRGIGRLDDRDRGDPHAQVLGRGRSRRRTPASPAPRELPVHEQHARPAPRRPAPRRRGSSPSAGRRARARRRQRVAASRSSRAAHGVARLDAGHEVLRRRAQVEQQLVRRLRELQSPHRVDVAGRRSTPSTGSPCRAASARPRTRAGRAAEAPARDACSSPARRAGWTARGSAASRSWCTTAGTCAASSGSPASARRTAASCAERPGAASDPPA